MDPMLKEMAAKHLILATPTGSGKSLVAMAMHFRALATGKRSVFSPHGDDDSSFFCAVGSPDNDLIARRSSH